MTILSINKALKELNKNDEPIYYLKHNKTNTFVKGFHYNYLSFPLSGEITWVNKQMFYETKEYDYEATRSYRKNVGDEKAELFLMKRGPVLLTLYDSSGFQLNDLFGWRTFYTKCEILKDKEKEVASILNKEHSKRKKLLKNDIFFLPDDLKEKFFNLNFLKMDKEELESYILKIGKGQTPEFRRSQLCLTKTNDLENANFDRNPVSLLSSFFEEQEQEGTTPEFEMSNALSRCDEIFESFTLCKLQLNFIDNKITSKDGLLTELTLISIKQLKV